MTHSEGCPCSVRAGFVFLGRICLVLISPEKRSEARGLLCGSAIGSLGFGGQSFGVGRQLRRRLVMGCMRAEFEGKFVIFDHILIIHQWSARTRHDVGRRAKEEGQGVEAMVEGWIERRVAGREWMES